MFPNIELMKPQEKNLLAFCQSMKLLWRMYFETDLAELDGLVWVQAELLSLDKSFCQQQLCVQARGSLTATVCGNPVT